LRDRRDFTPKVLGYRSVRLKVLNNAIGQLEIPLSGNGVLPIASLSFRQRGVWTAIAQYHRHRAQHRRVECGLRPLLVSNVTVTGDFRQTNDCAGAVAANAGAPSRCSSHPPPWSRAAEP